MKLQICFFLAGDKFTSEMHLGPLKFVCSIYRPLTKANENREILVEDRHTEVHWPKVNMMQLMEEVKILTKTFLREIAFAALNQNLDAY